MLDRIRIAGICLPRENNECFSNYYQFAVRFKQPEKRDTISAALFARGIDTARYLSNIADIAKYRYEYAGDCANAELCARSTLIIPNHYTLTHYDLEFIVNSLNSME
jgi:perosamine synthetase